MMTYPRVMDVLTITDVARLLMEDELTSVATLDGC